jgi:hypothetical protein
MGKTQLYEEELLDLTMIGVFTVTGTKGSSLWSPTVLWTPLPTRNPTTQHATLEPIILHIKVMCSDMKVNRKCLCFLLVTAHSHDSLYERGSILIF